MVDKKSSGTKEKETSHKKYKGIKNEEGRKETRKRREL